MNREPGETGSRRLALWLTAADALLLGSVTAFVTALSLWSQPWLDGPILFLWAALPVVASRLPRELPRGRRLAVVAALLLAGTLGWRFIACRVPTSESIGWELQTALLIFWSSGFLIVQPLTYRLFDALALGAITIGLLDGRPLAGPFVALGMLCWFAVLSLRHRFFDLNATRMVGRPRVAAMGGFVIAMVLMAAMYLIAGSLVGRDDLIRGRIVAGSEAPRRIGWGGGPMLSDLRPTEKSSEPFFAVQLRDRRNGSQVEPAELGSGGPVWLWRMRVFDRFAGKLEDWTANPQPGPAMPGIRVDGTRIARSLAVDLIRVSAAAPFFPTLYGTADAMLVNSEVADSRLQQTSSGILSVTAGGQLRTTQGDYVELGWDGQTRLGDVPGPEHLLLPDHAGLRRRLAQISQNWSGGSRGVAATREALGQFFTSYFQYALETDWPRAYRDQESRLLAFLTDQRRGDCNYFALASCLIFRSVGIPCRLAQGFIGIEWDSELDAWAIIEGSSHVWAEYWLDGSWRPFDGTAFVGGGDAPRPGIRSPGPEVENVPEIDAPAPEDASQERSLAARLLAADEEGSRLALLLFVMPILAILVFHFLRRSDSRVRPTRSEIQTPGPAPVPIADLALDDPALAATARGRIILLYGRVQRRLAGTGRQRRAAETPRRHAARILREHPDTPESMIDLARLADRGFYGGELDDHAEIERIERELS